MAKKPEKTFGHYVRKDILILKRHLDFSPNQYDSIGTTPVPLISHQGASSQGSAWQSCGRQFAGECLPLASATCKYPLCQAAPFGCGLRRVFLDSSGKIRRPPSSQDIPWSASNRLCGQLMVPSSSGRKQHRTWKVRKKAQATQRILT